MPLEVARAFRDAGIRTEMDLMERGLGAQLAHASKSADFAVVIGKREVESGEVTLKDLKSGEAEDDRVKKLELPGWVRLALADELAETAAQHQCCRIF